jgi:hypothetical protein
MGHFPFAPERHEGVYPFPRAQVAALTDPIVVSLQGDHCMAPRFIDNDVVLLDRMEQGRVYPHPRSAYVVEIPTGTVVRYIRYGGRSLYLLTEDSAGEPRNWDYLSLAGRNMLEIIRGRIVWMGRKIEAIPAEPARKAG